MTPDQIDLALGDLEARLDRLRALYEQYFMGIERLEPSIPRKDVDRRIHDLRKIRFQNTARRFRFQTLVQRYSTMQQYWGRICREIENGTYRRHRLKAERTVGAMSQAQLEGLGRRSEEPSNELDADLAEQFESGDVDTDALLEAAFEAAFTPAALPRPAAPARPAAAVVSPPTAGSSPAAGHTPTAAAPAASPTASGSGLLARLGRTTEPHPGESSSAELRRPGTDAPARGTLAALGARPAPAQPTPSPAAPARAAPASPAAAGPVAPPRPAPSGAAPAAPPRNPAPAAPPRPPASPARPAAESSAGLSEDRLRQLHQSYLMARKATGASPVSFEKMASSLRETEEKLRSQYKGRKLDFEVDIKEGKAILKPKLS